MRGRGGGGEGGREGDFGPGHRGGGGTWSGTLDIGPQSHEWGLGGFIVSWRRILKLGTRSNWNGGGNVSLGSPLGLAHHHPQKGR